MLVGRFVPNSGVSCHIGDRPNAVAAIINNAAQT
jgi:hypothetical protein